MCWMFFPAAGLINKVRQTERSSHTSPFGPIISQRDTDTHAQRMLKQMLIVYTRPVVVYALSLTLSGQVVALGALNQAPATPITVSAATLLIFQ